MSIDNRSPGIIIQGPLVSKGRVPRSESVAISDLKESDIVTFNCLDQVAEICKVYSDDFPIVIATWKTEEDHLIERLLLLNSDNVKVILLEDQTPCVQSIEALVPGNNKYRQIYSTLKATEELLSVFKCTHVIKLRTDMMLDVNRLWLDFVEISMRRQLKVLIPSFSFNDPSQIPDVYFVCKTNELIEFFSMLMSTKQWFASIHNDLFYRWVNMEKTTPRLIAYIFGNTRALNSLYLYAWSNFFSPASYDVFKSVVWRGEKYNLCKKNSKIFNDVFVEGYVLNKDSFNLQSASTKLLNKLFFVFRCCKSFMAKFFKRL